MIIFKKRDENVFVITNFKVMYSSLRKKESLIRVYPGKRMYLHALESWVSGTSKFYLVVRNPFKKVMSFYKNKFISAERNRASMMEEGEEKSWQICTEPFFPYLGLSEEDDPNQVSEKLKSTSFDKVISILPEVHLKDGHMVPQHHSLKFPINRYGLRFSIPIKFEKIFKMEEKEDLKELERVFDIDLSKKANNSDDISEKIPWDEKSIQIVANLYKEDFQKFNYAENPEVALLN